MFTSTTRGRLALLAPVAALLAAACSDGPNEPPPVEGPSWVGTYSLLGCGTSPSALVGCTTAAGGCYSGRWVAATTALAGDGSARVSWYDSYFWTWCPSSSTPPYVRRTRSFATGTWTATSSRLVLHLTSQTDSTFDATTGSEVLRGVSTRAIDETWGHSRADSDTFVSDRTLWSYPIWFRRDP